MCSVMEWNGSPFELNYKEESSHRRRRRLRRYNDALMACGAKIRIRLKATNGMDSTISIINSRRNYSC